MGGRFWDSQCLFGDGVLAGVYMLTAKVRIVSVRVCISFRITSGAVICFAVCAEFFVSLCKFYLWVSFCLFVCLFVCFFLLFCSSFCCFRVRFIFLIFFLL